MIEKLLKLATLNDPELSQDLLRTSQEVNSGPFAKESKREQLNILQEAENLLPKVARKLDMSIGELDAYLDYELEKSAANTGIGAHIGRALADVGLNAIGSIGRLALNDLYHSGKGALTEKKYYENMIKHNPDLHEYPQERVKSLFKTLHTLGGTELSSDPNVAGTFVRGNALYGDKGVDLKGVNDLIGSRSNLLRSRDVIQGPQGTPGLSILQRAQEEEKNRDSRSNNDRNYNLNVDQYKHMEAKDEFDAGLRSTNDKRQGERHALELAQLQRDEQRREREHRLKMQHGGKDTQIKDQDIKYKYQNKPPNRP